MIGIKTEDLCQKFKAPLTTLFLEIIPETPASHHLKKSKMALVSHGINIIGTYTSLDIAEPCSLRMLFSQKVRHKGLHTGYVEHYTC